MYIIVWRDDVLSYLSGVCIPLLQQWSAGVCACWVGIHRELIDWWSVNLTKARKHECLYWAQLPFAQAAGFLESLHNIRRLKWAKKRSVSGHFLQAGAHSDVASMVLRATAWADCIMSSYCIGRLMKSLIPFTSWLRYNMITNKAIQWMSW